MPGLLDILTQAMSGTPSGILGNLGAETPNQRVADAFGQLPPGLLGGLGGGQSPQQQQAPGLLDNLGGQVYDRATRQWWRQPDMPRVGPFPTSMRETAASMAAAQPQQPMQLPPGLAQLLLDMMSPQGQQIPPMNGQVPQMAQTGYGPR
mgnify:CR=1 FL=1